MVMLLGVEIPTCLSGQFKSSLDIRQSQEPGPLARVSPLHGCY